ncbi:uncharacterized protein ATC70_010779 [Mucor velutinosus]|uniref:ATP-dependent DNA helicase n=1 Tax=Mucor velutinosus TaxID=708070 RepID=A0AAN7DE82_9FUNG|nr:hypothetical protein ATC70_010779 [Mucor velutinosus]
MRLLQNMMHEVNPFVELFKTMEELSVGQPGGIQNIRMVFRSEDSPNPRRCNRPRVPEMGILLFDGDDESSNEQPKNRDIVLRLKGSGDNLTRINETNQFFDPLQYVLMFPFGDPGWHIKVKSFDPSETEIDIASDSNNDGEDKTITIMQYYSSRLMVRQGQQQGLPKNQQISLHSFGRLFHQYVVDMYAKMEQQRLNFIRFNQDTLRAAVYSGLQDAIQLNEHDISAIGKKVILPSTFIGGPRFMAQLYQDAMNLVRRFGKPDLFITFTCNPAWPEITRELLEHQIAADRPDLCARVFHLKLKLFIEDAVKKSVLGKVIAYVYSIEFQKRGLPHCHMLFILQDQDKPMTTEQIDRIVSAEMPDPASNPLAYETVSNSMIHGPCGLLDPNAPCMVNGKCSKNYPYPFMDETTISPEESSKIRYRRRLMTDRTISRHSGRITIDNRWVVPHNLYLVAKYNAHINVEIYSQVNSVKYIYKYVYKGHGRAQVYMGSSAQDDHQDEIKKFLDARYVSASEACWRIMSFPMHKEYPSTQRLDIHLENDRRVYFNENKSSDQALSRTLPETTLTAWFKYNLENPEDNEAKQTLYPDFCEKYVFHKQQNPRVWRPRRSGFGGAIGRVYAVSPKDIEKYHLRILLYRIPGATSFTYMRTYNGRVYPSYQATARAMGLLQDDNEWNDTMSEASTTMSPQKIRQLFCILLSFCDVSDPFQLWLNHRLHLAEDYLYRRQQKARALNQPVPTEITDEMYSHCLLDLNQILVANQFDLKTMDGFKNVFSTVDTRDNHAYPEDSTPLERMHATLLIEALEAPDPNSLPFNPSQLIAYNAIQRCALADENYDAAQSKLFFIDGPGGTGKTFIINALLDAVRKQNHIAIAVASTGTAALLLKGGRTAHTTFKIPIDTSSTTMCDFTPSSEIAQFIKRARLIIWDECSMIRKDLIETVDRTFKDVVKNSLPFGSRLIVFAGDFCQVLPIVPGASRSGIVSQCINRCYFWPQVRKFKLETNMRVQQALEDNNQDLANQIQQFSSYLLQIGERKVRTVTLFGDIPSDFVRIPDEMYFNSTNLLDLLAAVFPNISNSLTIDQYFAKRVILTPKNQDVSVINNLLLDNLPGRKFTYYSYDQVCDPQFRMQVPLELLNSIESGSLPPHALALRVGSPIMILRNLDPSAGLCNGTRLIVKSLGVRIIEATIATGPKAGDIVYILRTKFITEANGRIPFDFSRTQFPVRLAFAMTINKSQGQTLSNIGLYLPSHVFSHGQLYVAMSRVSNPSSIRIMVDPDISILENLPGHYTHNIVYSEVFQTSQI